jgi:hypothetical protein
MSAKSARKLVPVSLTIGLLFSLVSNVSVADNDAETKALDSTATQWSFQLAYQNMADYHHDLLSNGSPRPDGLTDYLQVRIVLNMLLKLLTLNRLWQM